MTPFRLITIVFLSFLSWTNVSFAGERDEFIGTYAGIDKADGMGLWLRPETGSKNISGRIMFPKRTVLQFTGIIKEGRINGVAKSRSGEAAVRISPVGAGMSVEWIPLKPSYFKREPLAAQTIQLGFVKEGTFLPDLPASFRKPPKQNATWVSTMGFIDSYQFWPAESVGVGMRLLPENHLAMMRMFGHFQTDVLWKVCQSKVYSRNLHNSLKEQGVDCRQLANGFNHIQKTGQFRKFRDKVAEEKALLRDVVGCSQGMKLQKTCIAISRRMSDWAMSFQTSLQVLNGY